MIRVTAYLLKSLNDRRTQKINKFFIHFLIDLFRRRIFIIILPMMNGIHSAPRILECNNNAPSDILVTSAIKIARTFPVVSEYIIHGSINTQISELKYLVN